MIKAYAADGPDKPFAAFEFDPGELGPDQVEVDVQYCGICHSDLSMLKNDWGMTAYPFVGGHEVVGTISAVGDHVPNLKVGQRVGVGWYSASCLHCQQCLSGNHNLCPDAQGTIINRHGGFAEKVRSHWVWTTALPDELDGSKAGPLFCGGITVFAPIVNCKVSPTDRVGVIGIGGLGHMALRFLDAWGCDVTAFSTSADKEEEARTLGADHFVNVKEDGALKKLSESFDFVLNTTNVTLDWDAYLATLRPKGTLHSVGAVESFGVKSFFGMLEKQRSMSGSPLGSPALVNDMIAFCARHDLLPVTETYDMKEINEAFDKLENGSPRYRLVLKA